MEDTIDTNETVVPSTFTNASIAEFEKLIVDTYNFLNTGTPSDGICDQQYRQLQGVKLTFPNFTATSDGGRRRRLRSPQVPKGNFVIGMVGGGTCVYNTCPRDAKLLYNDGGRRRQRRQLGSIGGNVQGDINNDDTGDVNLAGVTIDLLDGGGVPLGVSTLTDASGSYVFNALPDGSYTVTQTNTGSYPLDVSDVDGGDPNSIAVTLGSGNPVDSSGNDFVDELFRTISGQVFENITNILYPIPNVTLTLID